MTLNSMAISCLRRIKIESILPILRRLEGSDVSARQPDISFRRAIGTKFDFLRVLSLRLKLGQDDDPETLALLRIEIMEISKRFPKRKRDIINLILQRELSEISLFDLEFWTEQEFYGQLGQIKEQTIRPYSVRIMSPKRCQRKRGYRDHGHLPSQLEKDRKRVLELDARYYEMLSNFYDQETIRLFPEDLKERPDLRFLVGSGPNIPDLERIEADFIAGSS